MIQQVARQDVVETASQNPFNAVGGKSAGSRHQLFLGQHMTMQHKQQSMLHIRRSFVTQYCMYVPVSTKDAKSNQTGHTNLIRAAKGPASFL